MLCYHYSKFSKNQPRDSENSQGQNSQEFNGACEFVCVSVRGLAVCVGWLLSQVTTRPRSQQQPSPLASLNNNNEHTNRTNAVIPQRAKFLFEIRLLFRYLFEFKNTMF